MSSSTGGSGGNRPGSSTRLWNTTVWLPWALFTVAAMVAIGARVQQVPAEWQALQRVWQRGGEVPSGQHRQLQLGRLFHASGVMASRAGHDVVWWQPVAGDTSGAITESAAGRAAAAVPALFRDGARRVPQAGEHWAVGLLAGVAAPMRVHVGSDESWLDAELLYVERGMLHVLARKLEREGRRFDWHVTADGLHLLGRGERPQPLAGAAARWQGSTGEDGPVAAPWVLDMTGVEWPITAEWRFPGVLGGALLALAVFGGMGMAGWLVMTKAGRLRVTARPPGGGGWVAALALGWCLTLLVLTLAAALFGGPGRDEGSGWARPVAQAVLVMLGLAAVVQWTRLRQRGLPERWRPARAGLWMGWGLILATAAWLVVRALVQIPFDAPGLVTHGYKVLLFERLGLGDPWVLLEAGREFSRPHYPHGFSISAWLAVPVDGWRLGAWAQWQVVLPLAAAMVVLGRMALALAGGRFLVLGLVVLWAGTWPVQRLPGTWYAEPLMLLFWCGALACWWRLLSPVGGQPAEGNEQSGAGAGVDGLVPTAWAGGCCAAAMIWVKNEGLVWWLLAVASLSLILVLTAGRWRAVGVGGAALRRVLAGIAVPGVLTALLWWGWRGWHGLGDDDLSMAAMLALDAGQRAEVLGRTAAVVRLWLFGEGWAWPFGGVWWLAAASILGFGWRWRRDPVVWWLLLLCGAGLLVPMAVFLFSTIEPLERHLIAVWRLMLLPSATAVLLVARLWGGGTAEPNHVPGPCRPDPMPAHQAFSKAVPTVPQQPPKRQTS